MPPDDAPAYQRIQAELRRRIRAGEYPDGQPLPSQRELSREFGVTLMTLRQAVEGLRREELLVTRHGLGTFPAPRRFGYALGPLRSLAREMVDQGGRVETEVVGWDELVPDAAIAAELGLGADERAVLLERLRRIDGALAVYQRSYLPPAVAAAIQPGELRAGSLYELLAARLGLEVDHARERLVPVVLDAHVARLLACRAGTPAMLSRRTSMTAEGRPFLHDEAFLPGDRLVVTADRRRREVSITYELARNGSQRPTRRRR